MISGYIYVTACQIQYQFTGFAKCSNNFVENMFINYAHYLENNEKCDYLNWKYNKILYILSDYLREFEKKQMEAKMLIENAYFLRNKQFHGTKNSQLENVSGFLYDIVNDTISFYIDYLDVYKDEVTNIRALYNYIKNIKTIKESLLTDCDSNMEKMCILYDSVRKI